MLLIEDDRTDADIFAWAIGRLRVDGCWAADGSNGLAVAQRERFDLFLIEVDLPDMPGIEVARRLVAGRAPLRFHFISRFETRAIAAYAQQLGALGVLARPLITADLITALSSALGSPTQPVTGGAPAPPGMMTNGHARLRPQPSPSLRGSVASRWASLVLKAIQAEHDPKTIGGWARLAGVSRSVLCECCRLMHITPHDARDFARLLRAVFHSGKVWQPETVLDLADARTLRKLLARGGLTDIETLTPTTPEFLARQQLIPPNNAGLRALRSLLFGESSPLDMRPLSVDTVDAGRALDD